MLGCFREEQLPNTIRPMGSSRRNGRIPNSAGLKQGRIQAPTLYGKFEGITVLAPNEFRGLVEE
jgi:hypothetical protein